MRVRRPQSFHSLVLVALVSGCALCVGPPPSPSPTPTPTATPTATPTTPPTFGQITHPTGATDVVLRLDEGGGLVPMGYLVTHAPQFTLYGDGTVVFKQIDTRLGMPLGGQAQLPFLTGRLDESDIQALLHYALETCHLATARDHYDSSMVTDAPTTVFNVNAAGVQKTVSIYALGIEPNPGPDSADLQAFAQLAGRLVNFQQQTGIAEVRPYDPPLYRVTLLESPGEPVVQPLAWPWTDVAPADFGATGTDARRQAFLSREQVAQLLDVPNGGHVGIWVKEPDGSVVQLGVRPLLPDEMPQPTG